MLDRSSATARTIDTAALRLGPAAVAEPGRRARRRRRGRPGRYRRRRPADRTQAVLLPPDGEQVPFELGVAGPDRQHTRGRTGRRGAGRSPAARCTGSPRPPTTCSTTALPNAEFTLVGASPLVLDVDRRRVRFGDGDWVDAARAVSPTSEIVLQQPGPTADCGWLGGDDHLWCVGERRVRRGRRDRRASASTAPTCCRSPATPVRSCARDVDDRAHRLAGGRRARRTDDRSPPSPPGTPAAMSASIDLVWIDEIDGDRVWAVHPWGINVIAQGRRDVAADRRVRRGDRRGRERRGAVRWRGGNDAASSRGARARRQRHRRSAGRRRRPGHRPRRRRGADRRDRQRLRPRRRGDRPRPSVGEAAHGTVDIASATTVSYQPERRTTSGVDQFDYTIVDGNGTEDYGHRDDRAAADRHRQPGTGRLTRRQPRPAPNAPVDHRRAAQRHRSRTRRAADRHVHAARHRWRGHRDDGPIGTAGARSSCRRPARPGTATFTYRPVDSFGAIGEAVEVEVEIAQPSDANRPPIVQPDALRVRRDVAVVRAGARQRPRPGRRPDADRRRPAGAARPRRRRARRRDSRSSCAPARHDCSPFEYTVDDGSSAPGARVGARGADRATSNRTDRRSPTPTTPRP